MKDQDYEEIKDRNPVPELVMEWVQGAEVAGERVTARCPLNGCGRPGFFASAALFYCGECGSGGDVVEFVKIMAGIPHAEAIRYLAMRAELHADITEADRELWERVIMKRTRAWCTDDQWDHICSFPNRYRVSDPSSGTFPEVTITRTQTTTTVGFPGIDEDGPRMEAELLEALGAMAPPDKDFLQ